MPAPLSLASGSDVYNSAVTTAAYFPIPVPTFTSIQTISVYTQPVAAITPTPASIVQQQSTPVVGENTTLPAGEENPTQPAGGGGSPTQPGGSPTQPGAGGGLTQPGGGGITPVPDTTTTPVISTTPNPDTVYSSTPGGAQGLTQPEGGESTPTTTPQPPQAQSTPAKCYPMCQESDDCPYLDEDLGTHLTCVKPIDGCNYCT